MVIYGFSIFLAAPRERRQGRLRFIIVSWALLLISSTSLSCQLVYDFSTYRKPHPPSIEELMRNLSTVMASTVVFTGDLLMVSAVVPLNDRNDEPKPEMNSFGDAIPYGGVRNGSWPCPLCHC